MSKSSRKFLGPISALIAGLLTSTFQNSAKANPALQDAINEALEATNLESTEGRPSPEPLMIEPSFEGTISLEHYSHSSHSSHSSHRSHYSSYAV